MTSRLLAFALACLIGSPTCWCCLPHDTAPVKVAMRSCCHGSKTDAGQANAPAKRHDCPCAMSQTKREAADGKVLLPKPVVSPEFMPAPPRDFQPVRVAWHTGPLHVDEDPPWRGSGLYERHCSRLL